MAVKLGYWDDPTPQTWAEGPFIMVRVTSVGWRIEHKGGRIGMVPSARLLNWLLRKLPMPEDKKRWTYDYTEGAVNFLNQEFKAGHIVLDEYTGFYLPAK